MDFLIRDWTIADRVNPRISAHVISHVIAPVMDSACPMACSSLIPVDLPSPRARMLRPLGTRHEKQATWPSNLSIC